MVLLRRVFKENGTRSVFTQDRAACVNPGPCRAVALLTLLSLWRLLLWSTIGVGLRFG